MNLFRTRMDNNDTVLVVLTPLYLSGRSIAIIAMLRPGVYSLSSNQT